jgi:hypothetical protein
MMRIDAMTVIGTLWACLLGCGQVRGSEPDPSPRVRPPTRPKVSATARKPDTSVLGREDRDAVLPEPRSPRVFRHSPEMLMESKRRLRTGTGPTGALERLLGEAGDALKVGSFSVTDKTRLPDSGDPHDYVSLAPYYWRDPQKLDGLPYLKLDGRVNPESYSDAYDAFRLKKYSDAVRTLSLAFFFTGEEKYAAHAARLIRAWHLDAKTRMNPVLRFTQTIPGKVEGRHHGIIDLRHLTFVVDAIGLIASSRHWTDRDQKGAVRWFEAYLDWLRRSPLARREFEDEGNHGTMFDVQVASYALFVNKRRLARWWLRTVVDRRIDKQIGNDGRQFRALERTRTFHYTVWNLRGLFTLASMGEQVGVDLWNAVARGGGAIRKALDYVAPYVRAGSGWPHREIGETESCRHRLRQMLRRAHIVYRESSYRALLLSSGDPDLADERFQLLLPEPVDD